MKCMNPLLVRLIGSLKGNPFTARLFFCLCCRRGAWCHGAAGIVGLSAGQARAGFVHLPMLATRPALCTLQIGVQYASRQAWIDFLRDANQMGKLRHPNLGEASSVLPTALSVRCSC